MKSLYVFVLIIFSQLLLSCSTPEKLEKISSLQWEVFNYLPSESRLISFMNLDALRKSSYWGKIIQPELNRKKLGGWLKDFDETGAGLKKDIAQIYSASWPGNNTFIIVFNNNFNNIKKIFNDKTKYGKSELNGEIIYTFKNDPFYNCLFIKDSLLLISNNYDFVSGFTQKKYNSLAENKSLIGVIERIPFKSQYWIATDQGGYISEFLEKLLKKHTDIPVNKLTGSITEASLCTELNGKFELQSGLGCKSFSDAHLIATALRSGISMDLFSEGSKQVSEILNKLKIESSGNKIKFKLSLSADEILNLKQIALNNYLLKEL